MWFSAAPVGEYTLVELMTKCWHYKHLLFELETNSILLKQGLPQVEMFGTDSSQNIDFWEDTTNTKYQPVKKIIIFLSLVLNLTVVILLSPLWVLGSLCGLVLEVEGLQLWWQTSRGQHNVKCACWGWSALSHTSVQTGAQMEKHLLHLNINV